ncbi:MAG: M23 family metallopeptidase, partial [Candidatus Paceibacterota bacterium]
MKNKKYILIFIFLFSFFIAFAIAGLKLPYEQNKSLNITQGYDGVSHQKTDFYALDFGKECGEAYGLPVLASYTGKVITVSENHKVGETKSYGNFVLIDHGNNILSRYAHLKKVFVKEGENIVQGQQVGEIGNTGTIITSCIGETRGTHLHFAMYQKQTDGTFLAYKPEPISGFNNLVAGMTLASDNILVQKSQPQGL